MNGVSEISIGLQTRRSQNFVCYSSTLPHLPSTLPPSPPSYLPTLHPPPPHHLPTLTVDAVHKYPSSSHYTRDWDKLAAEVKREEKDEKLEGDAALNKLFQQIYTDGSEDVQRAMNKSFVSFDFGLCIFVCVFCFVFVVRMRV